MNIKDNPKIMAALNALADVLDLEHENGAFPTNIVSVFISHTADNGATKVANFFIGCNCQKCLDDVAETAKSVADYEKADVQQNKAMH